MEIGRAQRRIGGEFPQAGELTAATLRAADIGARLTEAATRRPAERDTGQDVDAALAADDSAGLDPAADVGPDHAVEDGWTDQ